MVRLPPSDAATTTITTKTTTKTTTKRTTITTITKTTITKTMTLTTMLIGSRFPSQKTIHHFYLLFVVVVLLYIGQYQYYYLNEKYIFLYFNFGFFPKFLPVGEREKSRGPRCHAL